VIETAAAPDLEAIRAKLAKLQAALALVETQGHAALG
jgi:hypothetical protein